MSDGRQKKATGIGVLDRPTGADEKARYVRDMFDAVAPRYDLLNTVLSMGIHVSWRRFASRCAGLSAGETALDVCTGTGDWAAALKDIVGAGGNVVGVDFSLPMLEAGKRSFGIAGVPRVQGDACCLPFESNRFDAATVAFGIRNVGDITLAFSEMARVVKPGGRVVCLEFSEPHPGLFRLIYGLYSRFILPRVGGAISGKPEAYTYLPESVARFSSRSALASKMTDAGLNQIRWIDLTGGIACIHVGTKSAGNESDWIRG